MGQKPRHQTSYTAYRIRQETFQGERLFRPDARLNAMVAEQFRRWRAVFGVVVYAYCIVESEIESVILVPEKNRAQFTCNLFREFSKRTNRLRSREDSVFPRPYKCQALLDEDMVLEAVCEVVCLPVERGLVTHPERWPGLVSLPAHPDDPQKQLWRARVVCGYKDLASIPTELPPSLENLGRDEALRALWQAIEARRTTLRTLQATRHHKVPSLRELLARCPFSKARDHRRSYPLCRASRLADERAWLERHVRRVKAHKETGRSYLRGEALPPNWPRGMHPPSWHDVSEAHTAAVEVA